MNLAALKNEVIKTDTLYIWKVAFLLVFSPRWIFLNITINGDRAC